MLDALEAMEAGLNEGELVRTQLRGVNSALRSILEHLGFEPFRPGIGDPFDPTYMECAGYAEGLAGVVLAAVRPGYRAKDVVVRPAGVHLAAPRRRRDFRDLSRSLKQNPSQLLYEPNYRGVEVAK